MSRATEMHLDELRHPPARSSLVFKGAVLECEAGGTFAGVLTLGFRTFDAGYPVQRLESVTLEIDVAKSTRTWGTREGRSHFRQAGPLSDTSGRYELQPFRARQRSGLLGRTWELHPIPGVELHTQEGVGQQQATIWASGLPHRDHHHPTIGQVVATGGTTQAHRYQVDSFLGGPALLDLFPGENTPQDALRREHLAHRGEPDPEPRWVAYPDVRLTLTTAATTREALHDEFSLLCSVLTAITGHSLRLDAFHYPTPTCCVHHCALYTDDHAPERPRFPALPLGLRVSLRSVLATCWPRAKTLQTAGFNVEAVSSWFDLGKCLAPVEQGFLNLFIYLEALKAHWLSARHGLNDTRNNFCGNVNRTLRDLLGYKQRIDQYVAYRNSLVHEGVTGLPRGDVYDHYNGLYQICSSSYLSLLGWDAEYLAWSAEGNLDRRTPRWTVPDLAQLQHAPVVP